MSYTPHITANEFVKAEMAVWTVEYIDDLLDRGYEPILLTDENGNKKWSWIYRGERRYVEARAVSYDESATAELLSLSV